LLLSGYFEIAQQLRLDALEPRFERGVRGLGPIGVGLEPLGQRLDALVRQRVGAVVAVLLVDREAIFLVLQLAEELQEALPADSGVVEIGDRGLVGRRLLGAGEGEEAADRRALSRHEQRHSGIGRPCGNRQRTKHQCRERNAGRFLGAVAKANGVAAGDMPDLVRDDALDLVGIIGRLDQAAVQIHGLAGGDESVDRRVIEQDDLDAFGVETRGDDQRPRHVFEQKLGLAVAQDLPVARGRGRRGERYTEQNRQHQQANRAGEGRAHYAALSRKGAEPSMKADDDLFGSAEGALPPAAAARLPAVFLGQLRRGLRGRTLWSG
jgi:hypothetical protein